jgi:glucose-6-phosphate 1-dehydrogenase
MITNLVLFGASGDLAGRFLLPALAALRAAGRLTDELVIVGSAREDWDDDAFRDHAAERLAEHAQDVPSQHREAMTQALRYRSADLTDATDVASVLDAAGDGPVAAYLALPPALFGPVVTALGAAGLPAGSRIAFEKPFGESHGDAVRLNRVVAETLGEVGEQAAFRVDHALGMATVQNMLGLRLANRLLAPLWNSEHIEQIEILWEETLALEGRAGYYDGTGALKDVMQNHMLQVLCLLAMEPPGSLVERDLRDAKVAVLRSIRPPARDEMASLTRRGRYGAGVIGGRAVPAYAEEEGVDPDRGTETFAEVVLALDHPRWDGTRIVLRAGKAVRERRKEAVVRFRPLTDTPFGDEPFSNVMRIGVDGPEDLALRLAGREAGEGALTPLTVSGETPSSELPPYGHVLLDLLSGGSTLSVRGDEAEEAWRVVAPVLEAWADGLVPLEEYPAGSAGPPPLTDALPRW